MASAFSREDELWAKDSRALLNPIIYVADEQRDVDTRHAGRAGYSSTSETVMEYLQSGRSRMWAARIQVATAFWLDCLAVVFNPDDTALLF